MRSRSVKFLECIEMKRDVFCDCFVLFYSSIVCVPQLFPGWRSEKSGGFLKNTFIGCAERADHKSCQGTGISEKLVVIDCVLNVGIFRVYFNHNISQRSRTKPSKHLLRLIQVEFFIMYRWLPSAVLKVILYIVQVSVYFPGAVCFAHSVLFLLF